MNKKTNKLYPGDIIIKGNPSIMNHLMIVTSEYTEISKNLNIETTKKRTNKDDIPVQIYKLAHIQGNRGAIYENLLISKTKYNMKKFHVLRYKGDNSKKIIKFVCNIIKKWIDMKKLKYRMIDLEKIKNCYSKISTDRLNKYNLALEQNDVPQIKMNCIEFVIIPWIMGFGLEKFGKNIKLNQEKINQYIPINPHRCSTIGVYKLSEKLPNYWEKFVIEDSAVFFDI